MYEAIPRDQSEISLGFNVDDHDEMNTPANSEKKQE
jgi:hypothetical protein